MDIITSILILLSAGLVLGQLFERYRLAAIAGEIVGGIILGPAVTGIVRPDVVLTSISDIALFFIVLLIGIEITTKLLTQSYRQSVPLSFSSFIIPSAVAIALAYFLFKPGLTQAVIVSVSVGVPSISIISVLLRDYRILQTRPGQIILSSVIITDLLAFAVLSFLTGGSFTVKIISIAVFLSILFYIDRVLTTNSARVSRAFARIHATEHGEKVIFGIIILSGLIASSLFQVLGFTFVLGALFSGMLISEIVVGRELLGIITRTLGRICDSFFIPLYFTIAGLNAVIPDGRYLLLLLTLLLVSGGLSPLLNYLTASHISIDMDRKSLAGFLGGRGAVGVVIASTAFNLALLSKGLYSVVLFATAIQSILFPLLIISETGDYVAEDG